MGEHVWESVFECVCKSVRERVGAFEIVCESVRGRLTACESVSGSACERAKAGLRARGSV